VSEIFERRPLRLNDVKSKRRRKPGKPPRSGEKPGDHFVIPSTEKLSAPRVVNAEHVTAETGSANTALESRAAPSGYGGNNLFTTAPRGVKTGRKIDSNKKRGLRE
ncbi:unnamed protein product, partial [Nesidiocoris tenuis]